MSSQILSFQKRCLKRNVLNRSRTISLNCQELEDVDHFVFHCGKYTTERNRLERTVEDILWREGCNDVTCIDLKLLGGYNENVSSNGQNELIAALMEFIRSSYIVKNQLLDVQFTERFAIIVPYKMNPPGHEHGTTWPDYLKEIARRSKAGFDSLHAELLQKYRDFSTKYRSNTVSSNRQLVKQDKQAVSTSNIHKPKDNQNTLQQTFVSYVAGKGQDEYSAVLSAETNIPPQDARQQSAHSKNIHVPVVNSCNSKANTMPILTNEGIFRQGKRNKTALTSRRSYKDHYEDIQLTNQHYQPCYDKVYPSLEPEHIYKTPQTQCNITNTTTESLKLDEHSKIQNGAEDQILNNVDSIYMNQAQICGTCTVDDYIGMESNESSTSFKDHTSYSLQSGIAKTNVQVPISDRSIMIQNDVEEQASNDEGSIYTNQGQMYEIDNVHGTEEYIAMARNDTFTSARDTYFIGSVTEKPLHQTQSNIIADKSKNTKADTDAECAKEDRMVSVTAERPLSAAIVPFIQATKPKPPIRPRMQFFLYTVEEVVECFNECAMPQLANVCREEQLDGEYFKDLGDEDLAQEPFCLKSFHISKVRKIIAGWRPKRLSTYKT